MSAPMSAEELAEADRIISAVMGLPLAEPVGVSEAERNERTLDEAMGLVDREER